MVLSLRMVWAQRLYFFRETCDHLCETGSFRCGDPFQVQSIGIDSELLEQLFRQHNAALGLGISGLVMTVTGP